METVVDEVSPVIADFEALEYKDFISKYENTIFVRYESEIDFDRDLEYKDMRGVDYYEVASAKLRCYHYCNKKERIYVAPYHQEKRMKEDAIQFKAIRPDITLDELVYSLACVYYFNYNLKNSPITKDFILATAIDVYNGNYEGCKTKRKRKVNNEFYFGNRIDMTPQQRNGDAAKAMTDDEIITLYDVTKSIEENIKAMKDMGHPHKKDRIIEALNIGNIKYHSDKDNENQRKIEEGNRLREAVIKYHQVFPEYGVRKLSDILCANGYAVKKTKISEILKASSVGVAVNVK